MSEENDPAMDRAMQLMSTKMNKLPAAAIAYGKHLCKKYGGCGEVLITAYAHYAQVCEGLTCSDPAYTAGDPDRRWFAENGFTNVEAELRSKLERAESEIARLKRGDFTSEEFQNLCHNRHEKPGCTRADFESGCEEYQKKLFGEKP